MRSFYALGVGAMLGEFVPFFREATADKIGCKTRMIWRRMVMLGKRRSYAGNRECRG